MDKLKVLNKKLSEKGFTKKQIDEVILILQNNLKINLNFTIVDLLNYAEKFYQKTYGEDETFFSRPVSSKLKVDISNFKLKGKVKIDSYKEFTVWMMTFIPRTYKRRPTVYDLHNSILFNIFVKYKELHKEKDIKKEKLSNKKILVVE